MSRSDKNSPCYECSKLVSGKKAFECDDCGEIFCKEHSKVNDIGHTCLCFPCYRKRIHLEVTLEMESQTLESKNSLNSYKEKLKNCKKDLSNRKSNIERYQNQIKINEKTYLRKFDGIEKKIDEEIKRRENLESTVETFESTLSNTKEIEVNVKKQLDSVNDLFYSTVFEMEHLKQENIKLRNDLISAETKSKKVVSYSSIRNTICTTCKNKIKISFRKELLETYKDRSSLIESVLAEKQIYETKKEQMGISQEEPNSKKEDKACCCAF